MHFQPGSNTKTPKHMNKKQIQCWKWTDGSLSRYGLENGRKTSQIFICDIYWPFPLLFISWLNRREASNMGLAFLYSCSSHHKKHMAHLLTQLHPPPALKSIDLLPSLFFPLTFLYIYIYLYIYIRRMTGNFRAPVLHAWQCQPDAGEAWTYSRIF